MKMNFLKAALTSSCLTFSATAFSVPVNVDPSTGLDSVGIDQRFFWDSSVDNVFLWNITEPVTISGIGAPGGSAGLALAPFWNIFLQHDSVINVEAIDGFMFGDQFQLVLDSTSVVWDSTYDDTSGYFHGLMKDLFLPAGSHSFSLMVTQGASLGAAWMNFSAATVVDVLLPETTNADPELVPTPTTPLLFALGLFSLGCSGKWGRSKKARAL